MRRSLFVLLPLLALGAAATPTFLVTIHPLEAIVGAVVGDAGKVVQLLPPAASPETFEPRPSDLATASSAQALFFVAPTLDGWASKLPAPQRVEMLSLVPEADRHPFDFQPGTNPHFWTDPLAVKAALPALTRRLCGLEASRCDTFTSNAAAFAGRLDALDAKLKTILAPVKGQPVILFHPDFEPFADRYGLKVVGVIELSPGREPTARQLMSLIELTKKEKVRALFGNVQLQPRPAKVIAESTGLKVHLLDPIGGVEGRESYEDLVTYNARIFAEALK